MSCPSSNSPGDLFKVDEEVEMPMEYYIYTALMIATVLGIPFLYQMFWNTIFDIIRFFRTPKHLRGAPPGCKRIGKPGDRNLSQEFKTGGYANGNTKLTSKVEGLFIYPIKSCYPVEIQESKIVPTGFEHDRQFCFAQWHQPSPQANESNQNQPQKGSSAYWDRIPHWHFMTQRQTPSLTRMKVEVWVPDPPSKEYDEESEITKSGGCMVVSFPFSPSPTSLGNIFALLIAKLRGLSMSAKPIWTFQIPLNPTAEQIEAKGYVEDKVTIWRDEPSGIDMTSEIPARIINHLKHFFLQDTKSYSPTKYARMSGPPELRLYRVDNAKDRNVHKCAPTKDQLGYQSRVGYHDSYPIHIQNMASIIDAETNIPQDKVFKPDSRRYRANIYDDWTFIRIGDYKYHVSCRTTRCKLPTNNPDTGVLGSDNEPYNYLLKNRDIDEGAPKSGCLGMMMVPSKEAIGSVIKAGDEIEVLGKGKHFFVADTEPEFQRPVL